MRARVKNGQWVFDPPSPDLPEGTVVEIKTSPVVENARAVYVDGKVVDYIHALARAAGSAQVADAAAEIAERAKAVALAAQRWFVLPTDVQAAAPDVLRRSTTESRIAAILESTPVP